MSTDTLHHAVDIYRSHQRMRTGLYYFSLLAGIALTHTTSASQTLEDLRSLTREWVALEQSIAKEAQAWQLKQTQLQDFIRMGEIEAEALQAELEALEEATSAADHQRESLLSQQRALEEHTETLLTFLDKTELQLLKLQAQIGRASCRER